MTNRSQQRRGTIPINISCSHILNMLFIVVLASVSHAAGKCLNNKKPKKFLNKIQKKCLQVQNMKQHTHVKVKP